MTDGTNATEFKISSAYQIEDPSFHGQVINTNVSTESDMGTDARAIVVVSGKKERRDVDFLPVNTIIAN